MTNSDLRWAWLLTLGSLAACGSANEEGALSGPGTNDGGAGSNGIGAGGAATSPDGGASSGGAAAGPQFPGAGDGFAGDPLAPGVPPTTAGECPAAPPIGASPEVVAQDTLCFYGETADPEVPAATIEQIVEVVDGKEVVHIRITFNPSFVDNTYGENAVGWGADPDAMDRKGDRAGHTFRDLVGSDHVELQLNDGNGDLSLHMRVDYVSEDADSPCGYGTLGVTGGEGRMVVGDASSVLGVATSLDRNLNGCGYCEVESSPATDAGYTPSPDAPNWDYRVVYEVWIDAGAFGAAGFGEALIESVHASPSKLDENTVLVQEKPCPPGWDPPICTPDLAGEGIDCGGGAGGSPGDGGVPSDGGACPPGYVIDLASEGRLCVPEPR